MHAMKKEYISPKMAVIELEAAENILESSYTDIGGTTDKFGANRRGGVHDTSEYSGEENFE